ncbi:MAG: hypothetical protein Q8T08_11895 [Ignavibacteria bacterium]|nr:hypothetical protein [Ignavibacteria bacterium]
MPPNPVKIPALMNEFIEWYYKNKYIMPILELATWIHYHRRPILISLMNL